MYFLGSRFPSTSRTSTRAIGITLPLGKLGSELCTRLLYILIGSYWGPQYSVLLVPASIFQSSVGRGLTASVNGDSWSASPRKIWMVSTETLYFESFLRSPT